MLKIRLILILLVLSQFPQPALADVLVGENSLTWDFPLHTYYMDSRTQTIYPQSEVGAAGEITGIELYVTQLPAQNLEHFYLRLTHTAVDTFSTTNFVNSGLSTVLTLTDEDFSGWAVPGWVTFTLDTPFEYNGTDNLLVDWVIDNSSYTSSGLSAAWDTGESRTLTRRADLASGDLLSYSTGFTSTQAPQLRLLGETALPVSGYWSGTHHITSDLVVLEDATLTIQSGSEILFNGYYGITVQGRLQAEGTENEHILFAPAEGVAAWKHIYFDNTDSNSLPASSITWADFSGGLADGSSSELSRGGAINFSSSSDHQISHCTFTDCSSDMHGGALAIHSSSLTLDHLEFSGCTTGTTGGAIYMYDANLELNRVLVQNCSAGTYGDAIYSWASVSYLRGLTIVDDNSAPAAIRLYNNSWMSIWNSIIWDNMNYAIELSDSSTPNALGVSHSDLEGGEGSVYAPGENGVTFEDILDEDPLFADAAGGDFHLTADSPCLDAGTLDSPADPDGTPADQGYFPYHQFIYGTPVWGNVSGNWVLAGSPYLVYGDLRVVDYTQLTVEPGVEVHFRRAAAFQVNGSLQAVGTAEQPIRWQAEDTEIPWKGFTMYNGASPDSTLLVWNEVGNIDESGFYIWYTGNLRLENTLIFDCYGDVGGSAVTMFHASPLLRNVTLRDNGGNHAVVAVSGGSPRFEKCSLTGNSADELIRLTSDTAPLFDRCTLAGNSCGFNGIYLWGAAAEVSNTILWNTGTPPFSFHYTYPNSTVTLSYSVVSNLGSASSQVVQGPGNSAADPQLMDVANGDLRLTSASPCIDAGAPDLPQDPDFTPCDVGAFFYNQAAPVFTQAADLPGDQGHQVQLVWNAGTVDQHAWYPATFYSVWRLDETVRSATPGLYYGSPAEALAAHPEGGADLQWLDRDEVWSYVGQVPAVQLPQYALVVPTVYDSSATDLHAADFRAIYHGTDMLAFSDAVSGYSVDNIAPDAVSGLGFVTGERNDLSLTWNPVTTGTFEGNSYPELNGIWYRVYGSNQPYFDCTPEHLLGSTTATSLSVDTSGPPAGFFRVVASDQE